MEQKQITKYQLIYYWGISSNTLRRMSHNEPISTTTMNQLCLILDCKIEDIIKFEPSPEELNALKDQQEEINKRKAKHKK